jgi:hypothetical protein
VCVCVCVCVCVIEACVNITHPVSQLHAHIKVCEKKM